MPAKNGGDFFKNMKNWDWSKIGNTASSILGTVGQFVPGVAGTIIGTVGNLADTLGDGGTSANGVSGSDTPVKGAMSIDTQLSTFGGSSPARTNKVIAVIKR